MTSRTAGNRTQTRTAGNRTTTRLAAAAVAVLVLAAAPGAGAAGDEVAPEEDAPAGCVTATSEDVDGCGAQGRDHFAQADHRPPVEACADATAPTGSRITRVTPDGPRRADGSLAFISGACVYLPPGYGTGGLRYPVVYVLHGGGGDQADWVTFGDIQGILDRAAAADPAAAVIAVMPDGRSGQFYDYEDGSFRIERYVLDHLVPFVDRHFRTLDQRAGRAIVGLSNGGYGAMHFAGKRPDLFVAAGGMSSNLGARTLSGLGADGEVHHQGSVPYQLAENYDGVDLVLDVANYCTSADPFCATIAVDLLFTPDHVAFGQRLQEVGHQGAFDLRQADGAHQFTWWSVWLEERQLPFLLERLADPQRGPLAPTPAPASFRYRSIQPQFSVWGYDITVDRDVREFLDLRSVTADGFEIQGSGRATVVTAPRYEPRREYVLTGTTAAADGRTVRADGDGRLRIDVDLGPSHGADQFTEDADLAEAQGGYWTVRTVTITQGPTAAALGGDTGSDGAGDRVPGRVGAGGSSPGRRATGPGTVGDGSIAAGEATRDRMIQPASATAPGGRFEPSPQLVPTVLFLLALGSGAGVLWRRRVRARQAVAA